VSRSIEELAGPARRERAMGARWAHAGVAFFQPRSPPLLVLGDNRNISQPWSRAEDHAWHGSRPRAGQPGQHANVRRQAPPPRRIDRHGTPRQHVAFTTPQLHRGVAPAGSLAFFLLLLLTAMRARGGGALVVVLKPA
jgi:hypothetical protein